MGELEELAKNLSDSARKMQESSEITAETTRTVLAANECLLEVYRQHLMASGQNYVSEQVCRLSWEVKSGLLGKHRHLAIALSVRGFESDAAERRIARLVEIGEPVYVGKHKDEIFGVLYRLAVSLNEIEGMIGPGSLLPRVQTMARNLEAGETVDTVRNAVPLFFEFLRSKAFFESDSARLRAAYVMADYEIKHLVHILQPTNFNKYFLEF